MSLEDRIKRVRESSLRLSLLSNDERNSILSKIKSALEHNADKLKRANEIDLSKAKSEGLSDALLSRLIYDEKKISSSLDSIASVINLPSPIKRVVKKTELSDNLILEKVTYPLGVIGMVFEARPDAMVQIISLAIKSGNGIILKGGREAYNTNLAIREIIHDELIDDDYILLLESHNDVDLMLKMEKDIDLLIPRGSNRFVRYCMENTHIPVMGHADGVCSIYISDKANLELAIKVSLDSKIQYPSACNAVETILVNEKVASPLLPKLKQAFDKESVIIHGCDKTCKYIDVLKANDDDFYKEYLSLEVNIKVVSSLDDALSHIKKYSSHHTDCIITEDEGEKEIFFSLVDSADVFCNCSTRFADGFRFGLGAEVGISTSKLHARGPVGLEGLTTTKFQLTGKGQCVREFNSNGLKYTHKEIL